MTKKNINLTYDKLIDRLKSYMKKEEIELVDKCYNYVDKLHFGEKRLTGEDYIDHPLNVAYILSETNADLETICAGLLHDVIDDCGVTKDELASQFSYEIAELVDGVTKINNLNFELDSQAAIANQRKIFVGLCEDVRVITIKLADRLHNMRTLWVFPEKKQKEKARETLEILTPIAHRLGMNSFKSELEDLSLRYLKPNVYFDIVDKLNQTKAERDASVNEMKQCVSELLNNNDIKHEIKGRAKSIYSIYKKLDKGKKFSDIYDLLALRVFVNTEQECYKALGIIHSKYKPLPKRFKDYIAMPKTNMYQSLHTTVISVDGYLFEIQIRTYEMDEIAERGIASHWSYKEQGSNKIATQNGMEQKLQFFRSIMELNNDSTTDEEFVKSIKDDLFDNVIYVFTPKGDVVELPNGSTPIDFAYKVHSGIGDKMVGAIVNNNIVPLDYELKNNDVIKVNTNKNSAGPSREWIDIAKTAQAKNKIRNFFRKIDKDEYLKKGEETLNKELRKKKISYTDFSSEENINKVLSELKLGSIEELYINIGNNKISPIAVTNIITDANDTKEDIIFKKVIKEENVELKNDVIVAGIDNIKISLASCCKPVPGDRIVGYITKGYGVSVHRMVCPNVSELEERIIDVKWNNLNKKYPTMVLVRTEKKENILVEIVSKASNNNINIQSINTYNNENDVVFDLLVLVENKERLSKFINDVRMISNIIEVERNIK